MRFKKALLRCFNELPWPQQRASNNRRKCFYGVKRQGVLHGHHIELWLVLERQKP